MVRRRGWSPRRIIALLGGGLIVIAIILFGTLSHVRWRATVNEAGQLAGNLADMLAEHAGRVFDAANLVAMQAIQAAQGQSWDEIHQSEASHLRLRRLTDTFDYISAVWLIDEAGTARLTTRAFPAPPISVADQAFFRRQRTGEAGPFISTLMRSPVVDATNIVMSRRIETPDGKFRGTALVVIDPNYFLTFYRSIRVGYPISIDLFRSDWAVIIHHPQLPSDQATNLRKWPEGIETSAVGDAGTIERAVSPVDTVERLEAYQRVYDFPVYVSIGIDRRAIFTRWLEGTRLQGIFAGLALAALLLLVAVAIWRSRLEEGAHRELEAMTATLEQRVRERTMEVERTAAGLRNLLAEKDVLVREVHHRVKNNLQIISSLLNLYANKFVNTEVQRGFNDCLGQVRAMGLVHELVYRSQNVAQIDFGEYLGLLGSRLATFFAREPQVRLEIRSVPLHVDLDTAIPLALLVTEAVTNAFKYAFPGGSAGTIRVEVTRTAERATVCIADDGIGLPADWEALQMRSLGLKLMRVLAEQIDAAFELSTNAGTTVFLTLDMSCRKPGRGDPHGAAKAMGRPTAGEKI
ncbi:MAG TPA: histidine kinase dimerization/phosphoacceptor domain -containing protein [Alphaproteobacteria bacterium]